MEETERGAEISPMKDKILASFMVVQKNDWRKVKAVKEIRSAISSLLEIVRSGDEWMNALDHLSKW